MSTSSLETVWFEYQNLDLLVIQELERQLASLPTATVSSIDRNQALARVQRFLPPGCDTALKGGYKEQTRQVSRMLQELIADAVSLSLLRLVCAAPRVPAS
ncbi:MAG: hypothetical protein ACP5D7_11235 [Limnospira sp.]